MGVRISSGLSIKPDRLVLIIVEANVAVGVSRVGSWVHDPHRIRIPTRSRFLPDSAFTVVGWPGGPPWFGSGWRCRLSRGAADSPALVGLDGFDVVVAGGVLDDAGHGGAGHSGAGGDAGGG